MKIQLSFVIQCAPDEAWNAVHSPELAAKLYGPMMQMRPLSALPQRFEHGDSVLVQLRLFGIIPLGKQRIIVADEVQEHPQGSVRTMHDVGGGVSGPLAWLRGWHHRMSVSPAANHRNRTYWQDELTFHGPLALLAWPALRLTWGWRANRIRRAAQSWSEQVKREH